MQLTKLASEYWLGEEPDKRERDYKQKLHCLPTQLVQDVEQSRLNWDDLTLEQRMAYFQATSGFNGREALRKNGLPLSVQDRQNQESRGAHAFHGGDSEVTEAPLGAMQID